MSSSLINDSIDLLSNPYNREIIGFKNTVFESNSGNQVVMNHTEHDRMRYSINSIGITRAERNNLILLYRQMKGSYDTFLLDDVVENFVSRVKIDEGTGSETVFQIREFEDGPKRWNIQDTPYAPAAPKVWVNGVLQTETTHYSIVYVDDGRITFVTPPTLSHDIEVEYYYYRRCRFTTNFTDSEVGYENINVPINFDEVKINI